MTTTIKDYQLLITSTSIEKLFEQLQVSCSDLPVLDILTGYVLNNHTDGLQQVGMYYKFKLQHLLENPTSSPISDILGRLQLYCWDPTSTKYPKEVKDYQRILRLYEYDLSKLIDKIKEDTPEIYKGWKTEHTKYIKQLLKRSK